MTLLQVGQDLVGSLVIAVSTVLAIIGSLTYAVRSFRSDAVETWRQVAEGRAEELVEVRRDLLEEKDRAKGLEADKQELRLAIAGKDTEIARLLERPDTEALHEAIVGQHRENQAIQQQIVDQLGGMNDGLSTLGQGITRLLERNQHRRHTDPPED